MPLLNTERSAYGNPNRGLRPRESLCESFDSSLERRREVGRWLLAEGYRYKPSSLQDPRFEVEIAECLADRPDGIYSMPGVLAIFTFVKPLPEPLIPRRRSLSRPSEDDGVISLSDWTDTEEDYEPNELKVQVIVAKNTPMECILAFHSSERFISFHLAKPDADTRI